MKYSSIVLFVALFSGRTVLAQSATDTFRVANIPFSVQVPQGWVFEEVNDGFCADSTYNFVMRSQTNSLEQGGQVALQFRVNKTAEFSENPNTNKDFKVTPFRFGQLESHYVTYVPRKVKGCKICGKEYVNVHVVPVSEEVTMYIYFVAHGSVDNVIGMRQGFNSFVQWFSQNNGANLDHFLLFNQLNIPNVADTVLTSSGILYFYSNDNFKVKKLANGVSLKQEDYFFSGLNLNVTSRIVAAERMSSDTTVTSSLGFRPGMSRYVNSPQNYLTIKCRRYLVLTDGSNMELSFEGIVQIEDQAMVIYYERVVRGYANSLVALNSDHNSARLFSFSKPANARRSRDIATLSGTGTRYGHINHDSLLRLMPGYLLAYDSLNALMGGYHDTLSLLDLEIARKAAELDSLRPSLSPLMTMLREQQLKDMGANREQYARITDDSAAYYERKYLGSYHDKLNAASKGAMENSKCSGVIDVQNVPLPDRENPMEFVDLNSQVAELLNRR